MRIGHGFDAHCFELGGRLILGGVEIPHSHGMKGHSDGDVVLHALSDALLGAAALGDIGQYFPETDNALKGIDSRILLRDVVELLRKKNYTIHNVDITIVAQVPKLAPYREQMCANIASDLKININQVNVKATTTDGMGFTGRKEGVSVYAVALIASM
jgi:2-C-methyl-D-erythritol 2,4-cyclodiphosphate synthase